MEKLVALILAFCCILPLAGCKTGKVPEIEVESFSYTEDMELYQGNQPVGQTDGFQNTSAFPINNAQDAISQAQNECTVEYDATKVYYDNTTDMWMIHFYKENYAGGGQSVYLDSDGITHFIIYSK